MPVLQMYFAVALGGAVGASLRFFIQQLATNLLGKDFPFGTLAVNIIGSFAIGIVYAYFSQHETHNPVLRAFIIVGVLGALTTFSTFSMETLILLQKGDFVAAILNVLLNVGVCFGSVWLALIITKG